MTKDEQDPLLVHIALATLFLALLSVRIWLPTNTHFDEGYYIPAALDLLEGERVSNREHPMLAKIIYALSIGGFGNNVLAWRIPSMLCMSLAIFFASRAVWWFTEDRITSAAFAFLAATCSLSIGLGRAATLDSPMLFFAALAAFALSKRKLTYAAVCCGLSIACKWSLAPLLPIIAVGVILRGPISINRIAIELARFSIVPFVTYLITFAPGFFVRENPLVLRELLPLQLAMLEYVANYSASHPYQDEWWAWLAGTAHYWSFAEMDAGAWRGVLMVINPITTALVLAGTAYAVVKQRNLVLLSALLISVALSAFSSRSIFLHQSVVPLAIGLFLASAMIIELWRGAMRYVIWSLAALQTAAFIYLLPLMTAAPFADQEHAHRFLPLQAWRVASGEEWTAGREARNLDTIEARRICMEEPLDCY